MNEYETNNLFNKTYILRINILLYFILCIIFSIYIYENNIFQISIKLLDRNIFFYY